MGAIVRWFGRKLDVVIDSLIRVAVTAAAIILILWVVGYAAVRSQGGELPGWLP